MRHLRRFEVSVFCRVCMVWVRKLAKPLQCLTLEIQPLCVERLEKILAFDFEEAKGATPVLNKDWR